MRSTYLFNTLPITEHLHFLPFLFVALVTCLERSKVTNLLLLSIWQSYFLLYYVYCTRYILKQLLRCFSYRQCKSFCNDGSDCHNKNKNTQLLKMISLNKAVLVNIPSYYNCPTRWPTCLHFCLDDSLRCGKCKVHYGALIMNPNAVHSTTAKVALEPKQICRP